MENQAQIELKLKQIPDLDLKLRLIAVAHLVDKRKLLDKEQEKEIRLIEHKYNQIFAPYYSAANELVNGLRPPNVEETEKLDNYLTESERPNRETYLKNQDPIVGYWLKALQNTQPIKEDVTKKDESILLSLSKIEAQADADNDNFSLTFTFEENLYFTNNTLKVNYSMNEEQEPIRVESTIIEWREGKDITKKIVKKKKNKKVKVKEVEQESFFNIFKNINSESPEFKILTEEQKQEATYKLNVSCEIGSIIYNEVIPYSLEYYLGVRVAQDYGEGDESYGEDDEDEEEDDENITKEEAIARMKAKFKPVNKKK